MARKRSRSSSTSDDVARLAVAGVFLLILTGTAGTVYQIHARATDQYGTVGAWSSWKTVTMPTDDRATSFGYTGTWTTGTSTSYYGGTYKLTSTPGAKVTVTAWTDQVSVIGHSMGGMLAARLALSYPQLAEQLVQSLAGGDGFPDPCQCFRW